MKKFISLSCLTALLLLSSCVDDDYQNIVQQGTPVINASQPQTAVMGQTIQMSVGCSDQSGTALSTLKAELCFSDEVVADTTIRTKEAGDYQVKLNVPFLQYIPNGDAKVRLTLQNVTTSKTIVEITQSVERPHFSDLQFVTADGTAYPMTEGQDYNYSVKFNTAQTAFKGHFATQDGQWLFGWNGSAVALGQSGNIDFQTESSGEVEVTFNTRDYTYGPNEEIAVAALLFSEIDNVVTREMVQGRQYTVGGIVGSDWFIDNDYFELNEDDTYTFTAKSGTYTLTAYADYSFLQVYAGTREAPLTIQPDGSGGLWVIGGEGINKPFISSGNNRGWWTGTEWDQAVAPIRDKVYQLTLTVGKQLNPDDINFKFFGQPDWGVEFKGDGSDYSLVCTSDIFGVGDGNGHDNGNIYLKDGAALNDGDTYIFGTQNGVLTVKKGASAGVQVVDLADKEVQTLTIKKGTQYQFGGIVDGDWFVDYDFFQANGDGTYTFTAMSGTYNLKAYADYKYLQVYPANEDGSTATIQGDGTGSIWIIGSECVNKPFLTSDNNKGWWTDPDWDICMAPVAAKTYRITLTVGQQLAATDINFKFFGQPTWGIEFNGLGGDYHLDTDNEWFTVNAADSDNGNIFLKDGVTLNDGDTFVFTIDLTGGISNGVLIVEKK